MVFRKSPDYRELSYLRSIQGWADPFHAQSARSARAGTRFSKVNVAASLHCSLTPKRPRVAVLQRAGSSVAVGRSLPPPALPAATRLQRSYAAHRTLYARRPLQPLLALRANAVRVDHERTGHRITAARAALKPPRLLKERS